MEFSGKDEFISQNSLFFQGSVGELDLDEKVLDKWSHDDDGKYDPEKVEEIRGILRRHNQIPGIS